MKTKIIFISIFFFAINSFAQTPLRESKIILSINDVNPNEFRKFITEEFTYDIKGNMTEKIVKDYSSEEQIDDWRGTFYEYDNNGLLIKETNRRFNQTVSLWITEDWLEYSYDDNGCLIEKKEIANLGDIHFSVSYERNNQCQIVKQNNFQIYTVGGITETYLTDVREFTYLQDGISYRCLLYTSPSPRDATLSRMPSSA